MNSLYSDSENAMIKEIRRLRQVIRDQSVEIDSLNAQNKAKDEHFYNLNREITMALHLFLQDPNYDWHGHIASCWAEHAHLYPSQFDPDSPESILYELRNTGNYPDDFDPVKSKL
jgi:hypothetical protein